MNVATTHNNIETVLAALFKDAKNDHLKMMKGAAKSIFRPMQPSDFKEAYLAISKAQGEDLVHLIKRNKLKNIVEFGTSFGISTLFLAKGALETGGHIVTTELIVSKAHKAFENFKNAGVNDLIDIYIGDAIETLKEYNKSIDLLLLDGWKNLYLPLFKMLEPLFHTGTFIYVDNADMNDTQAFLRTIAHNPKYRLQPMHHGKVVLISVR